MSRGNAGFIGRKATPNLATDVPRGIFSVREVQQLLSAGLYNVNNAPASIVNVFRETTTWTVPVGVSSVEVLIIAGGGGGGNTMGGGGGAGGYVYTQTIAVSPGQNYLITIGAGGAGATVRSVDGSNGGNTTITLSGVDLITPAVGGGGGASWESGAAANGGSGGGAAQQAATSPGVSSPAGQGFAGGTTAGGNAGAGGGGFC